MEIKEKDEEIKKVNREMEGRISTLENIVKRRELNLKELKTENNELKAFVEEKERNNNKNDTLTEAEEKDESEIDTKCQQVEEIQLKPIISFNCIKCNFIGKNISGLKIHDKAKHKEKEMPLMQRFSNWKK